MKTYLVISLLMFLAPNDVKHPPTSKLELLFTASFPNAENAVWNKTKEGYSVFFGVNGIQTHLEYDNAEKFVEQKRYYTKANLPAYVLMAVKRKYPDRDIKDVTEVTTRYSLFYQLHLNDSKYLYVVTVSMDGIVNLKDRFILQHSDEKKDPNN